MYSNTKISNINNVDDIIEMLLESYYTNYAQECSELVIEKNATNLIYNLATQNITLPHPKPQRDMIIFRAAYILEAIYFTDRNLFEPYYEKFWSDFTKTSNESAKRHFGKIMVDLLKSKTPSLVQCDAIAETCILWITDPKSRIAVQMWAIEILLKLRNRVEWLQEILPEILEPFTHNTSPAIISRLRKWRKMIKI